MSTRKVDDLVKALGVASGISKSEVSRICAELDRDLEAFRNRPLDHVAFPYVFADATYVKGRVRDASARLRWLRRLSTHPPADDYTARPHGAGHWCGLRVPLTGCGQVGASPGARVVEVRLTFSWLYALKRGALGSQSHDFGKVKGHYGSPVRQHHETPA